MKTTIELASLAHAPEFDASPALNSAADLRVRLRKLVAGAATMIPKLRRRRPTNVGHPASALRSYGLWLRHAVRLHEAGCRVPPSSMIELGPGDSLGTSLAALLSGVGRVFALDAIRFASPERDAALIDDLVALYRARTPIPDTADCSDLPHVSSTDFPSRVFPDDLLDAALAPARVQRIRNCMNDSADPDAPLVYVAPWSNDARVSDLRADLVLSHSVLEYVDDPARLCDTLARRLVRGGFMSHFVDYSSIGFAPQWDGHWAYSDLSWRLVRGRRAYIVNRLTHSELVAILRAAGAPPVAEILYRVAPTAPRDRLARRFREMSDEDRSTHYALLIARAGGAGGS